MLGPETPSVKLEVVKFKSKGVGRITGVGVGVGVGLTTGTILLGRDHKFSPDKSEAGNPRKE